MTSSSAETTDRSLIKQVFYGHAGSRLRATWRILVVLAVALPIYYGANLLVPALLGMVIGSDPSQTVLLAANLGVFASQALVITIAALVALLVGSRLDDRRPTSYGFKHPTEWIRDFVGGVAIGAAAVVITLLYEVARGRSSLSVELTGVGVQSWFVAVVVVAVMLVFFLANNVFEEVVFRGIFITTAAAGLQARSVSPAPAVLLGLVVSSPVFGLYHFLGDPAEIVTSTVAGVLFGVAYVLTGQLGLPIGVHFGGVVFVMIRQEQFAGGLTLPTLLVAEPLGEPSLVGAIELWTVRALAGIVLLYLWIRVFYDGIRLRERFAI